VFKIFLKSSRCDLLVTSIFLQDKSDLDKLKTFYRLTNYIILNIQNNLGGMEMLKDICNVVDKYDDDRIKLLERMVNIDSGRDNPAGIKEVAHIVGDKLSSFGFEVEYLENEGICTHLIARKAGKGNKNIMVMGHMDTVFAKGTAAERPFTIKDGKAYGPGVLDMKGGVVIALSAMQALYETGWNENNLTVFFCGDEESAHPKTNAPELFTLEANGKDAVFNMETGDDNGAVVVGRKGVLYPEMHVKGKAVHAGKDPQKGYSAVLELANKVVDLHNLTDYESGVTYNVGVISGGTVPNAVAGEAHAKIDIRVKTIEQAEQAKEDLKKIAEKIYVPGTQTSVTNDKFSFMPMETTDAVMQLFKLVQEQGRLLGIKPEIQPRFVGGGSDACWTVMAGAPSVCAMGARGELNHGEHEYIQVYSLNERAKLLACSITAV